MRNTNTKAVMTSIYFHGFNSAPDPTSSKIKALKELGDVEFVQYNTFDTFDNIFKSLEAQIDELIETDKSLDFMLVGTSLGGFWASKMSAHTGLPAVLINPSTNPRQSLERYVGIEFENYVTGEFDTMKAHVPSTYSKAPKIGRFLILLDEGDDVFDANKTKDYFTRNSIISFSGGSHRFEHMQEALSSIKEFYNYNLTTI